MRLYQVDCVLSHVARIKRLRGKALNEEEEKGYSLIQINNVACKPLPFIRSSPLGGCSILTKRVKFMEFSMTRLHTTG